MEIPAKPKRMPKRHSSIRRIVETKEKEFCPSEYKKQNNVMFSHRALKCSSFEDCVKESVFNKSSLMTAATFDENENEMSKAIRVFIMMNCDDRYQKYWMQVVGSQLVFYTD